MFETGYGLETNVINHPILEWIVYIYIYIHLKFSQKISIPIINICFNNFGKNYYCYGEISKKRILIFW